MKIITWPWECPAGWLLFKNHCDAMENMWLVWEKERAMEILFERSNYSNLHPTENQAKCWIKYLILQWCKFNIYLKCISVLKSKYSAKVKIFILLSLFKCFNYTSFITLKTILWFLVWLHIFSLVFPLACEVICCKCHLGRWVTK